MCHILRGALWIKRSQGGNQNVERSECYGKWDAVKEIGDNYFGEYKFKEREFSSNIILCCYRWKN